MVIPSFTNKLHIWRANPNRLRFSFFLFFFLNLCIIILFFIIVILDKLVKFIKFNQVNNICLNFFLCFFFSST